jgi:hypothetical protein
MKNITVEFTYDLPDDQYYETNELKNTGTLTYTGPATKYLKVNLETDKLTGYTIQAPEFEDYNNEDDGFYAVEVDCNKNPLLCAIVAPTEELTGFNELVEDIPGDSIDYIRSDPPAPNHTYNVNEITYNRSSNKFVKPFPWKGPANMESWEDLIFSRNNRLRTADIRLSDDLPTTLYNEIAAYKQYLRDFPETFGAAWSITIQTGGSNFVVGDRLLISDSVYKNNTAVNDIIIKVESVDSDGAITSISRQGNVHAYAYHKEAGTYADVYHTTNSTSGTGSVITLSKVKTVDPWKITVKDIITDTFA